MLTKRYLNIKWYSVRVKIRERVVWPELNSVKQVQVYFFTVAERACKVCLEKIELKKSHCIKCKLEFVMGTPKDLFGFKLVWTCKNKGLTCKVHLQFL